MFCLKVRVMERDREIQRAIFHLLVHSVDGHKGQSWVQELGTYSGSPMWAQEPKHLEHPLLLSQAVIRELNQRWSSWNYNQCPYGTWAQQVEDWLAMPTLQS